MHELVYLRLLPTDPHAAAFRKGQGDAVFNRSRMYAQALVQRVMFFAPDVWNRVEREAETHGLDLLYLWWLLLDGKQRWSLPPRLKYALRGALAVFLLQEQNALGRYVGGRYAPLFGLVPLERPEQRYYDVTRQPLEYYEDKYDAQGKGGRPPPGVEAPENSFSGQEAVSALARWADIEFRRTLVNYVATAEATAAKDVSKLYGALYGTPLDPQAARHHLLWDLQEGVMDKNRLQLKDRPETVHLLRWLYGLSFRRTLSLRGLGGSKGGRSG
jgi:hypothetical protein